MARDNAPQPTARPVGLPWYEPAQFEALARTGADPLLRLTTYHQWRRGADALLAALELQGARVVCVPIEPDALLRWCAGRQIRPDSTGRVAYAQAMADRQAAAGHLH